MKIDFGSFFQERGIEAFGFVKLHTIQDIPFAFPAIPKNFLQEYKNAILFGVPFHFLGKTATGDETALFLEKTAKEIVEKLEHHHQNGLIIHTDDEFDPVNRLGFISLKMLARLAGLGWQGRSLLIISPTHGPLHRLIAVLTNIPVPDSRPLSNQCGRCTLCIDACPEQALTAQTFQDHPRSREDVLAVAQCRGDFGCTVCIEACPYFQKRKAEA